MTVRLSLIGLDTKENDFFGILFGSGLDIASKI